MVPPESASMSPNALYTLLHHCQELAQQSKLRFHRAGCLLIYQIFKRRVYIGMQRNVEQWKDSKLD